MLLTLAMAACSGRPSDDASGEEIYAQLCSRCHGADLAGGVGPALNAGSAAAEETDEFMEFTIVNGRGRMPSFDTTLDEIQLERLVAYIRRVQDGG